MPAVAPDRPLVSQLGLWIVEPAGTALPNRSLCDRSGACKNVSWPND
jgi:hypothetical protein